MAETTTVREVVGPWSLATCRDFWAGFTPAPLRGQHRDRRLRATFLVDTDWSTASAIVRQDGTAAHLTVTGPGDLDAAAVQTARFLALDVDARGWPAVGERDPVIGTAQRELPGLRPCGFYSPYEAAAWAVLSQRVRRTQAAAVRARLVDRHGVFPPPAELRTVDLDLFGRKTEYLHAVAEAALDGVLDGAALRALTPEAAIARVREIKGLGPFGAELVVLRGANHPDGLARHEARLNTIISARYGRDANRAELSEAWRPYRTWAGFHLRATE